MSITLGSLFERYIGRQLRQLEAPGDQLCGEFEYGPKKQKRMSHRLDLVSARQADGPV